MREKLKHIFLVLTPAERKQFWILIVLNIFVSIADIAMLAALLFVISFYINTGNSSFDFLPAWLLKPGSISLILFFFILFTAKNLLGIIINNAQFRFTGNVATRISKQKLETFLKGSFERFINIDSSELIRRIAFQPFEYCQHILLNVQQVIIQLFLVVITLAAITFFDPKLFFLLLVILTPPVIFVFFYIKKKTIAIKNNLHAANENSFQYLLDALKGFPESNIYQRHDFFLERFAAARKHFSKHLFTSLAYQSMPTRIIETFAVMGLFILIAMTNNSVSKSDSAFITIGAFMAAAYKVIPGIVKIINAGGQIRTYDLSLYDKLFTQAQKENKLKFSDAIHTLQLKNVSFGYKNVSVLNNFSLCIQKGDFVGIIGRSGKGKTTVLNLLAGFLSPQSGNILLNNEATTTHNYSQFISYVRQQPFFIHDSILRNITLSEGDHDEEKMEAIIKITGLAQIMNQPNDSLDKVITENGKNISGGQQQRIAIARALYKDPAIFLLDEPFNELDEASAILMAKYFKQLAELGKTVVMVTHDAKCLAYCNKVISLDE